MPQNVSVSLINLALLGNGNPHGLSAPVAAVNKSDACARAALVAIALTSGNTNNTKAPDLRHGNILAKKIIKDIKVNK